MSIKSIEAEELREMTGKEGLILQGCGGPLQDWLDGINDMLTEAGILQNGSRFNLAPESAAEKASVMDKLKTDKPRREPKQPSHGGKSQEREI